MKRVLTGEILHRIDIQPPAGLGIASLLLKRERSSGNEYVVLVAGGGGFSLLYCPFDLEEFDRFIEAADDIRAAQTSLPSVSAPTISRPAMILRGEVLRRVDTEINGGYGKLSLRLKREKNTPREYIVLAMIAPGWYLYYPYELDEFHRLVTAAKKIRDAARSFSPVALQRA